MRSANDMTEEAPADHAQGSRASGAGADTSGCAASRRSPPRCCRRADGDTGTSRRAHRHSQSALRFVLEGKGPIQQSMARDSAMEPGDVVIRRDEHGIDHSNETSEPMLWLDGHRHTRWAVLRRSSRKDERAPSRRSRGPPGSFDRDGHNCCGRSRPASKTCRLFNYPYSYTREALEKEKVSKDWDDLMRLKLKFSNPEKRRLASGQYRHLHQVMPKG